MTTETIDLRACARSSLRAWVTIANDDAIDRVADLIVGAPDMCARCGGIEDGLRDDSINGMVCRPCAAANVS